MHHLTHPRTRIILVSIALLIVAVFVSSSSIIGAHAAAPQTFSQMQMYSSTFTTTNLPTDGTTQATLTTIPFTLPSKGKVEVTAIFSLVIFDPLNRATGCVGCNVGTLACAVLLDSRSLTSLSDVYYSYNVVSQEYSMTTTTTVKTGSHTIALQCIGLLNPNFTNLVMQATGRGMSALVIN